MEKRSRQEKRVIRKADQMLETGAITYSRHREIMENIRKGRPLKPLSQKEAESQRMTVEQMEKRALILSRKLRKEPGEIMEQLISQEQQRRKMTPLEKKAAKELQRLIDKGYLGEDAYIDHDRGYFLRFGATVEEETPAAPPPKEAEEGYSGILRSIRRANDRIADEELSRKIDRLEQISALIFKEVEEHPEKRDRIRTFFDYYLPTTQKLLDAYAEFEETGVEGEHLGQAKDRIEETMDAIVEGFEHQLDELYSADAMDVFSDIKVMETMLHRDTASAAKDFGYTERPKVRPKADAARAAGQSGNQTAAASGQTSTSSSSAAASAAQAAPTAQPEAEDDGGVQQLRL